MTQGGIQNHWGSSKEKGQPAVPMEWRCWLWLDTALRALTGKSRRIVKRLTPSCLPQGRPMMIITEYMENGALDTFLRVRDSNL